jgi:hypothetical protein
VLVVGLFAVSLVAAQTCQKKQIRVTKGAAVATATRAVDFRPTRTQVRLVRQGLNGHPFWAVSLSIPAKDGKGFERLTTARVDANTGKLVAITRNTNSKEPTP